MLLVTFATGSLFVLYIAIAAARQADRDLEHVRVQMRLLTEVAASRLDDHVGGVVQLLKALAATLPVAMRAFVIRTISPAC